MKVHYLISLFLFTLLFTATVRAQSEPEYRMEIGAGAGFMNYLGDFNGNFTKEMQPSATLVYRYIFNPRQGLRFTADYGKLKGSSSKSNTAYPDLHTGQYAGGQVYDFDNSLYALNAVYEYNFWPYGTGREYRGAKPLTPYVFAGIGLAYINGVGVRTTAGNIPIGIGIKYKIGDRLNLSIDWTMYFTTSDRLDGVKDPYRVETSGLFKNSDCYSGVRLSLTYSFKEKCRVCHNDDE